MPCPSFKKGFASQLMKTCAGRERISKKFAEVIQLPMGSHCQFVGWTTPRTTKKDR